MEYVKVSKIPGTAGFLASQDGRIFDRHGVERPQYTNGDGYKTCAVVTNHGRWLTFGVHRLVALAFLEYTGRLDELAVNHKDTNKSNNALENLEWVSVKENNVHHWLLRGSRYRPMILAENPEGNHEFISDLYKAAKKFDCDIDYVWDCIKSGQRINGWKLTHFSTNTKIPKDLQKRRFTGTRVGEAVKIKLLNIETQEILHFGSYAEAASYFGASPSHVHTARSKNGIVRLFKKKYLVVLQNEEFPVLTQEMLETASFNNKKEVLALNLRELKFYLYPSAKSFISHNTLSKKSVTVNLKKDRVKIHGDWVCLYFGSESFRRLVVFANCPELQKYRQEDIIPVK